MSGESQPIDPDAPVGDGVLPEGTAEPDQDLEGAPDEENPVTPDE